MKVLEDAVRIAVKDLIDQIGEKADAGFELRYERRLASHRDTSAEKI